MSAPDISLNGLTLTPGEQEKLDYLVKRLNVREASLYRTSTGLRATMIDGGGARHLGVAINPKGA